MNSTNRGLNRLFTFVVGLLLLAVGLVGIALGAVPAVASGWRSAARTLGSSAPAWIAQPVLGRASWLVVGVIVLAVVLIVLLLVFMLRQGHGHTGAAIERADQGASTRIDLAVPKALLEEHLAQRDELTGVRISAYEVRSTPMLKITARCRRGVSPAEVAALLERSLTDLETIVGTPVPAFVQLTGGFRAGGGNRARVA